MSVATILQKSPGVRLAPQTRSPQFQISYLASLEADSHLPEVQNLIRDAIQRGTIRVFPAADCPQRVRIIQVAPEQSAAMTAYGA